MSDGRDAIGERATLTGVEALVRLLVLRRELDVDAGLDTGAMVSGYPGSPLAGVDLVLEQQRVLLEKHRVLHVPGVNEELALATAWGSQMGAKLEFRGVDGVVGAWYGKTPGLDRSGDVLRHANAMGSGPNGGLVLFCGDDPSAKSSTLPCDSQYTFQDACVPLLYPGDQQEVMQLGVHAFAMSRWAGPLVGLKIVTAVADGSGTVELGRDHYRVRTLSDLVIDGKPWRHQPLGMIGPHQVADQELLIVERRLVAARAYVRQQGLDRVFGAGPGARLGVVTAGKTFIDVIQAFADLGVSQDELSRIGVRVLKLAMTYPLVDETVVEFGRSVVELVVIEEKRPFIEVQLRAILHEAGCSTHVVGKRDREGRPLTSSVGELDASQIANVLARVLPDLAAARPAAQAKLLSLRPPPRPPEYCSGCPHNRSTVVPEGALVGGGVGCHGIMYFEARQRELQKLPPPPMGAEGVPWIGLAPFVTERHLFQNLGDGTFSHSGTLAIRASVAAGVNVTFKILYNAAVAMTGGQAVAGLLDVPALTRELEAEGVARVVVCAEDPEHYDAGARWAPGVEIVGRQQLQEVQAQLREVSGVTVIIYDQRCAAEARRMRRRGLLSTPPARVVINEAVCEGCGDCRTKSNCASVLPHQTEFGEKRRVDDLTCNRDYSCLEGNCPSFVTIVPKSKPRSDKVEAKPSAKRRPSLPAGELPIPKRAEMNAQFGVYFTGIGGTGVITAGRILAAAAEAAGLCVSSMDQTGLAQRGGAVVSHIHFARDQGSLGAATIGSAGADLYLSGDIFQAAAANHLAKVRPGATIAAIDREITPTAALQQTGESAPELAALHKAVSDQIGEDRVVFVDSRRIAEDVFSQHVLANVVLLGAAFQLGGLPLSLAEIEAGLKQRGLSEANRDAFEWGRWAVHDPVAVDAVLESASTDKLTVSAFDPSSKARDQAKQLVAKRALPAELVHHLERRVAQVIDYQNATLGRRFLDLVERVARHDAADHGWQLTRAATESWFKLLTYKDEYEVARLHSATRYDLIARSLGIEGPYELKYHLQPRQLLRLGLKRKLALGWLCTISFVLLRHMKFLRGTPLDFFGWDRDRRLERAVIEDYRQLVGKTLEEESVPYAAKVELAASALEIKGYDSVKERSIAAWRTRVTELSRSASMPTTRAAE